MQAALAPVALDPRIEAWLRAGAGEGLVLERVIETSISWVFLFEDRVLKLKKPLDLGFLDFSTPGRRLWAARRELAFNRLTAPDIYRRVLRLRIGADGVVSPMAPARGGGAGALAEVAVEMRRFDAEAMASAFVPLPGALAERLGRRIAGYHGAARAGRAGGGAAGLAWIMRSNAEHLRAGAAILGRDDVEALIARTRQVLAQHADLLDARLARGLCRACHGDLHLGNVLIEAGEPVLFDAIEFSDRLREIDVLYDAAFLFMDLAFRDDRAGANRAFNGWLDEAARHGLADAEALGALPLFQSVRAGVRAHVRAREGVASEARRYLALALGALDRPAPRLTAVGGLSGSGKTTRARALAPGLGGAPGAVVLRSDEIRKRLFGAAPTERLDPGAYTPQASERVYTSLLAQAAATLRAGTSVVADAVFLRPDQRQAIEAVARAAGAPFEGLWLAAPRAQLEARLAERRGDASDADAAVLRAQLQVDPGPIGWSKS